MTDQDLAELHRMVAEDPLPAGPADVASLRAAGSRRLRRQRIGVGAAAVAALAAVGVPAYVVTGGDTAGPSVTDPAAPPPMATAGPGAKECGALLCVEPGPLERKGGFEVAGEPWVLSRYSDGSEEVVYAMRVTSVETETNERTEGAVLSVGRRTDTGIDAALTTLDPLHPSESPDGDPARFWSSPHRIGDLASDEYIVVGFVPGTPEEITWSTPDGESGTVAGADAAVLDGFTAFYLTRERPPEYDVPTDGPRKTVGGGREVTIDRDGPAWPLDLTIHTSDGWSCSLADCGTMG